MNDELLIEKTATVTTLTLNRPDKANALGAALVDALSAAVAAAHVDGTRLLLLKGNGRNFCAGFDFGGFEDASEGDLLLRFARIEMLLQSLYHAPFATMALAQGKNFGAGVDLILACASRIAAPDAAFRMPGLKFGLQLGTRRLAARIGGDAARALLAASKTFGAEEGLRIGFLHQVAPLPAWAGLIELAVADAQQLSPEAAARLNTATVADTRAPDLADLIRSAIEPGLKERIGEYRKG
ncbi:MAG: enoyl-CoA hydratase/isomerase family protein [Betaproteobacteria bacterium]|nr:MAG: enoyl-CoA hydratase/isomerase family protein [Betaproteobacteria bacterium]